MRTTASRLAVVLALALAAPAARADLKLGYVDSPRAMTEVEEGKAVMGALQRELQDKEKQAKLKFDELARLQEDFQKQQMIMTPEAKSAKIAEVERKNIEAQEFAMKLQQELTAKEREAKQALFEKLSAVVRAIAEAEGFTMVLEARGAVIYAPTSLDLTNEVIRKFNAKFPGSAAKKADAPAKKADAPAPAPAKK
jgi:outer membrane protein